MHEVIRHAAARAEEIARRPIGFHEFWLELNRQQQDWAGRRELPGLLAHLGVSLCERAVLDALCRALGRPLHQLLRANELGLRLGDIHPELHALEPRDLLPPKPLARLLARHTVGLADPLTSSEIPPQDRMADGLPHDLESNVHTYGLRCLKIKLSGQPDQDIERLRTISTILERTAGDAWFATLDGNENFHDLEEFQRFWARLAGDGRLRLLQERVLVVEQPVHRNRALSDNAGRVLSEWPDHPPLIIDESDGELGDLPRALDLGYAGTSHKNCKGIVKGIANACLLQHRRRQGLPLLLTGEDLANLGPVALVQDLAMMALLGISHVERNGHHYFRGLSMWPAAWQETVLAAHPDLYQRHVQGFAHLRITAGELALNSLNAAPFGLSPLLDPEHLPPPS
jgi:L-alanine-DL-glutamate epimerase-like enolase superfamily enzyme